jgi:hypothetical protein
VLVQEGGCCPGGGGELVGCGVGPGGAGVVLDGGELVGRVLEGVEGVPVVRAEVGEELPGGGAGVFGNECWVHLVG